MGVTHQPRRVIGLAELRRAWQEQQQEPITTAERDDEDDERDDYSGA